MTKPRHRVIAGGVALFSVGVVLFGVRAEEGHSPMNPVMLALSRAVKALDPALLEHDAAEVAAQAQAIVTAASQIPAVKPQSNRDLGAAFDDYADRLGAQARELATLGRAGQWAQAGESVEELRRTCVACHARFRNGNERRGMFPARRGSIVGEVRIVTQDGAPREDRSGVVVFLDRVAGDTWRPPLRVPVISQRDRTLTPHILAVVKGTAVRFPNDDTIFHNIFSLSKTAPFDLGIYEPGTSKTVTLRQPGLVKVYCNIHPQMSANILVLDNPFFDITDERGQFAISGIPAGTYTLRAWHEFGGDVRHTVEVAEDSLASATLEVREDRKVLAHRNKFGLPYDGKYQ